MKVAGKGFFDACILLIDEGADVNAIKPVRFSLFFSFFILKFMSFHSFLFYFWGVKNHNKEKKVIM